MYSFQGCCFVLQKIQRSLVKTKRLSLLAPSKTYTQTDGSDLDVFLNTLFDALDTDDKSSFTQPLFKVPIRQRYNL